MQITYIREETTAPPNPAAAERDSGPSARGYSHKVRGSAAGPDANQGR
jgi:hypothetical protein